MKRCATDTNVKEAVIRLQGVYFIEYRTFSSDCMSLLVQSLCATKLPWAAVSDNIGHVYWWISQRHPDDDACRPKLAADFHNVLRSSVTFFCTWRGSISILGVCSNWGRSAKLAVCSNWGRSARQAVLQTDHRTQFWNCMGAAWCSCLFMLYRISLPQDATV